MDAGPVKERGGGGADGEPQTLVELVQQLLRGMVTEFVKNLPKTLAVMVAVTVIHTYLLVVVNEGFAPGDPILGLILVLQGKELPVALFWLLLGTLGFAAVQQVREKRLGATLGSVGQIPTLFRGSFDSARPLTLSVLLFGAAFMVAVMSWLGNVLVGVQLALVLLGAMITQGESLTALALRLGYADLQRNRGPQQVPAPFNPSWTGVAIAGSLAGMVLALLLNPGLTTGLILGIVLAAAGYLMIGRSAGPRPIAPLLLFCALAFAAMVVVPALADDGGWAESGGTFEGWVQSEGAAQAVVHGGVAGVAAAAGVALGAGLAGGAGGAVAGTPPGGPQHGETRTILDGQGRPVEETYNEAIGAWETEDERMIRISREGRAKDAAFIDEQRRKLETRDTAQDRALDETVERQKQDAKTLDNLQKIRMGILTGKEGTDALYKGRGEAGDVITKVDELIRDLTSGKSVDRGKVDRIKKIYGDARRGDIISERDLPTENETSREAFTQGWKNVEQEVVTGRTPDGDFSWKSLGLRIILGVATGGGSEFVYQPVSSLHTMHDYVQKGGDSVAEGFKIATEEAIKQELWGRAIGGGFKLAGKGLGAAGNAIAPHAPKLTSFAKRTIQATKDILTKEITVPKLTGPGGIFAVKPKLPPGSPLRNAKFTKAPGVPPNLKGMSEAQKQMIEKTCKEFNVRALTRPGGDTAGHIAAGRAHPKISMIHQKTISKVDTLLTFAKENVGLVGCKKPVLPRKPPDMSGKDWYKTVQRFNQRLNEVNASKPHLEHLEKEGKIIWDQKTGLINHAKTGKGFAGDVDPMAFVDATTGEPVSKEVYDAITSRFRQNGVFNHNDHISWDYSKTAADPVEFGANQRIDQAILNSHKPGGEALNTYDPNEGWYSSWLTGGERP